MHATKLTGLSRLTMRGTRRSASRLGLALALAAATLLTASAAEALITRIVIDPARSQSPTFGGLAFGTVGQYEKLRGTAFGELDPADPHNAVITDIELAPRNRNGKVEYSMDIFILKPIDLATATTGCSSTINNRGEMRLGRLNDVAPDQQPDDGRGCRHGFVMNLGYTVVGNGWDFGATRLRRDEDLRPDGDEPGGSPITGPSYEYIVFDNATSTSYTLTYPAATLDKSQATLTVRARLDDPPVTVPASGWEYTVGRRHAIRLLPAGNAVSAERDLRVHVHGEESRRGRRSAWRPRATVVSFLRHAYGGRQGNPLAGDVQHTFSYSISQPSRTLNDFVRLGFNEDEGGRRVIDGILSWTGGGSGDQINYRFAQTGRTERNRQNHLYPEGVFPFAHQTLTDHLSGKTDGRDAAARRATPVPSASRSIPPTNTGSRPARCCTPTRGATI